MNNKKFKIGDRVRIIDCSSIEPYELNKIGTIVDISSYGYVIDMGRPRRPNEPDETRWYLHEKTVELVNKLNTQLLFNFMNEE